MLLEEFCGDGFWSTCPLMTNQYKVLLTDPLYPDETCLS